MTALIRNLATTTRAREVVDALDAASYVAFGNVEPAGTRMLLALDVSGSMTSGAVAGIPGLTPRDASAALALVTAATERRHEILGFQAPPGAARDLAAPAPRRRHPGGVNLRFGGTDCALPMLYARARKREIDTFVVYTDSETSAGDVHPVEALRDYSHATGIDARLVV